MPFIPHTPGDVETMLAAIGVGSIDELFDEIPEDLCCGRLEGIPEAINEMDVARLMRQRAASDAGAHCFIGAGAYDHHIPAAVWEIVSRGEFYSAYTPYQAEASQGTLQLMYEFQTMIAGLTGMEVANASLYDGASALAEAVLMAVRLNRQSKSRRVLLPRTVHPVYREVTHSLVNAQGIELVELPYDPGGGHTPADALARYDDVDITALVIPQPNFFGVLEDVDAMAVWAQAKGVPVIGVVNPVAMALLKPPGEWGHAGADIVCGEGQPLGVPLSSGGPYFGFMCCKQKHVRQMPGRIVGKTIDMDGKPGFTLTLQAREQHIRRSKATSNICTNQGLMVIAATLHMALMGAEGLTRVARTCHASTASLVERFSSIDGVEKLFDRPYFHEVVVRVDAILHTVMRTLAAHNVLGGYRLARYYPELGESMLVCVTEMRSQEEIESYANTLNQILVKQRKPACPVAPKM